MKATCNESQLVMLSVMGEVHHPLLRPKAPYRISADGIPLVLPGVGGITYNVALGDCVFGLAGDHIEPGVSLKHPSEVENMALNTFACIGNTAVVVSGDAKGDRGFVTGTHGGVDHVIVYFAPETLEKMCIDDKVLIRSCGQGMKIAGFEDSVRAMNLDPSLFERMNLTINDGKLVVPVAATIPAHLMGSGIGQFSCYNGDYDIMTADRSEIERFGLNALRFGDIVLLQDCDNAFGRVYRTGAVSIGVVIHSDCVQSGHGPGVTTLLTSQTSIIEGVIDSNANLANYYKIQSHHSKIA